MSERFVHINELLTLETSTQIKARANFSIGRQSLDDYIQKYAKRGSQKNVGQTHVLIREGPLKIIGYYTLSNLSVKKSLLTSLVSFPAPEIPAILIARLAVDEREQGRGYGKKLMVHALVKIQRISQDTAVKLVIVDALDDNAKTYYLGLGFREFDDTSERLFMAVETIEQVLA